MPRLKLEVTLEEKGVERTEKLVANGRDIRAYEAEFDESFMTETSFTQFTKIAWITLSRLGRFDGDYEAFEKQCVDLDRDYETEVDPADPTQKGPGGD